MIRAVVFDLWNTLVHSPGGDPFRHLQQLLPPDRAALFPDLKRDAMVRPHPGADTLLAAWRERLGLPQEGLRALAEVFQAAAGEARLFPEAVAAVRETRRLARTALLSNTQSFDLEFLERLQLTELLRPRFLSAEMGCLKPDRRAFETVQERLGLFPGEIAMVGDSWRDDVAGALEAGWTAIWVNRSGSPRPDLPDDSDMIEIQDLGPVPRIIEELQAGARCNTCLG